MPSARILKAPIDKNETCGPVTESNKAVFLSYASEDATVAQRICEALRSAGIEVWFDQSELRGGDVWDHKIRQQIHDCALFIPIISANTVSRPEGYFRLEWALADHRTEMIARNKAFVVPVCIDRTPDSGADVPESFLRVQWIRLPNGAASAAFCERITTLLERGGSVTQVATGQMPAYAIPPGRKSGPWIGVGVAVLLIVGAVALRPWRWMGSQQGLQTSSSSTPLMSAVPEKSIAVLPFVDMSEKKDQEYFSDGLSEELIDHLSHTADLKVIARTSSFAFKGKNEDMRTIATKLGVANLLEGSVRKAGPELRITAQLIRASDGVHLWSETYERKLNDIFKVQDEISTTVAKALNVALGTAAPAAVAGPPRLDVYNLMLQGNYYYKRGNKGDMDRAIEFYRQVTALDPNNTLAWAKIAGAYVWQGALGEIPSDVAKSKAQGPLRRSLAIDPALPKAHYVLGNFHLLLDLDWDAANLEFERVIALDPNGDEAADARLNIAVTVAARTGRVDGVVHILMQNAIRNPLDASTLNNLGGYQYLAGHLDQSAATLRKVLDLNSEYAGTQAFLGFVLLSMGKPAEALAATEKEPDEGARLSTLSAIYWATRRRAESDAALRTLEKKFGGVAAYGIADVHAFRGEMATAMDWLERAYQQRDGSLQNIKIDPLLRPLHSDPRFRALLRKLKLPEA